MEYTLMHPIMSIPFHSIKLSCKQMEYSWTIFCLTFQSPSWTWLNISINEAITIPSLLRLLQTSNQLKCKLVYRAFGLVVHSYPSIWEYIQSPPIPSYILCVCLEYDFIFCLKLYIYIYKLCKPFVFLLIILPFSLYIFWCKLTI